MKQVRRRNRNHRKYYPKRDIEYSAEHFVFFPIASAKKTEKAERLVQDTAEKADKQAQPEHCKLILRIHLTEEFCGKAFTAVGNARYIPFRQKSAVRFGKARDFEVRTRHVHFFSTVERKHYLYLGKRRNAFHAVYFDILPVFNQY